jgi:signal transduction histidine kinase
MDKDLVTQKGQPQLKVILESAGDARNIIAHLLQFSRSKSPSPEVHDPGRLLDDAMQIVRQAVPASTSLEVHIEGQPPCITFDRTAFVQILLNLVSNASAATDGVGTVKVVLDGLDNESEHKRHARLRVSDNGHGMDQATLERAFEPFFTTKPVGQGTGLGLSVIYGLVHEAHGTIDLHSEVGCGTTVTILLPEHSGDN